MICKSHKTVKTRDSELLGWKYYLAVADPEFVKREGRESKCRDAAPGLKKSLSREGGGGGGGGIRHIFFFFFGGGNSDTFFFLNFFGRHLHYGVGVPSACQTDLRGEKQKKKKWPQKRGVRQIRPPPPPPPDPPLLSYNKILLYMY